MEQTVPYKERLFYRLKNLGKQKIENKFICRLLKVSWKKLLSIFHFLFFQFSENYEN